MTHQQHRALGSSILPPWPEGGQHLYLGMGCFWGAEKALWNVPGVYTTRVGYQGGTVPHPTYAQVCTGTTGHAEVVHVVYHGNHESALMRLLMVFWEQHDPTQGLRQGNDIGSQYRSMVVTTTSAQQAAVRATAQVMQAAFTSRGRSLTTEMLSVDQAGPFYLAEDEHQQYLVTHPHGYCPSHATGISLASAASTVASKQWITPGQGAHSSVSDPAPSTAFTSQD